MSDSEFWTIIAQLDWDRTGDDEAVVAPAVRALANRDIPEIEAFESILSDKLFGLDSEAQGKYAYRGPDHEFSVDLFLYARCCVAANGHKFFYLVCADPTKMPKDMEFEALWSIGAKAYEQKTGQEFQFASPVSYGTFRAS